MTIAPTIANPVRMPGIETMSADSLANGIAEAVAQVLAANMAFDNALDARVESEVTWDCSDAEAVGPIVEASGAYFYEGDCDCDLDDDDDAYCEADHEEECQWTIRLGVLSFEVDGTTHQFHQPSPSGATGAQVAETLRQYADGLPDGPISAEKVYADLRNLARQIESS